MSDPQEPWASEPSESGLSAQNQLQMQQLVERLQQSVKGLYIQNDVAVQIWEKSGMILRAEAGQLPLAGRQYRDKPEDLADKLSLIQQALDNPQAFKGSLTIYLGDRRRENQVLNIRDGEILQDNLRLLQVQTQALSQPALGIGQNSISSPGKDIPPTQDKEPAVASVEPLISEPAQSTRTPIPAPDLATLVTQQQQQIDYLTQQLARLEKSVSPLQTQVTSLQERVETIGQPQPERHEPQNAQLQDRVGGWLNHIYNHVLETGRELKNTLVENLEQRKEMLLDRVVATKESVRDQFAAIAVGGLATASMGVAKLLGEEQSSGRFVLESSRSQQRLTAVEAPLAPIIDNDYRLPVMNPQMEWERYSEGIGSSTSAELSKGTAIAALSEGHSRVETIEILRGGDPEYQRLKRSSERQADDYANLVVTSAQRELNRQREPEAVPQQQRQVDIDR